MASRRLALLAGSFIAIMGSSVQSTAFAQNPVCKSTEDLEQILFQKYEEQPAGRGTTSSGGILQIYRTADGATWSAVVHLPDGRSCLVANGDGWRDVEQVSLLPEA